MPFRHKIFLSKVRLSRMGLVYWVMSEEGNGDGDGDGDGDGSEATVWRDEKWVKAQD